MVHEAITKYLQGHEKDFGFHADEVPFNPYLRDATGSQRNWRIVLTYKPTAAQFRCHFSADAPSVTLAQVLDVIRTEILMLNEYPDYTAYAQYLGLPFNDAMDERDARHVFNVALRHRGEFVETFGAAAEYLLGYKEIKPDDGLEFW